jgi:hypothetical protein
MIYARLLALLSLLVLLISTAAGGEPVDFEHDIAPIIKARCAECHTDGTYKGSFSLDTREALLKAEGIVPGKPEASPLIERVTSTDPETRMPPKGKPLSAREVELLKAWIATGASWPAGVTFKRDAYLPPLRPRRVALPNEPSLEHPIDRIVMAYYRQHRVTAPKALDDVSFLRRAYLDIVGLLPPVEELGAYLSSTASEKRGLAIDRLLDDRQAYADHWLTFWNDLLRNDYKGTGYTDGGRKQITFWLYQSLLANKPYDQFVHELISPPPGSDAEGFGYGIKWRGRVNASQVREIQFSQNVSQVFFGINMKCASCHDSFIDRWKLEEAYSLAAIIADEPLEIHRCDKATGKMATPGFLWPELGTIDPKADKTKRLAQLADLVTHPENGRFQRTIVNRIWQRLMGRGIVHPVDVMANRPWSEDLLDYLAIYLTDHQYDLKQLIRHIMSSRTYQSQHAIADDARAGEEFVFRGPEVKRMTAEEFIDAVWAITDTRPAKIVAPLDAPPPPPGAPKAAQKPPAKQAVAVKPPPVKSPPKPPHIVRASLVYADLLMRSLGRPNREQVVTTREDLLTTLQALDLSNGMILADTLDRGAANLLKARPQPTAVQLIDEIYRQALSRPATSDERETAASILGPAPTAESVADLLWTVFMLPEFQLIR